MVDDKRITDLQDEIKLLKGELKNSLASVRDYLLNMELPSSEFSTILAALNAGSPMGKMAGGDGGGTAAAADTNLEEALPAEELGEEIEQPPEDEQLLDFEAPEDEKQSFGGYDNSSPMANETIDDLLPKESEGEEEITEEEVPPEDELMPEEEVVPEEEEIPEDELEDEEEGEEEEEGDEEAEEEEELLSEPELPVDEEETHTASEADRGIPKVNMLANLINWVARAKQEIGYDRIPSFLEVYGISGHLSPELKDVIMRLAELSKDLPDNVDDSAIWSQSMLSLHGILTGGESPQNPVIPAWVDTASEGHLSLEDEIIEIDKNKDKAARLKLVLPDGDGNSKEFCIDLTPESNGNGSQ